MINQDVIDLKINKTDKFAFNATFEDSFPAVALISVSI